MWYRIGRIVMLVVVGIASIPLTILAMERGFGLAASLIVPTCCLGFSCSLVSPRRTQRIGWFAFASVCAFLLPANPWWQRLIEAVLDSVQNLIRTNRPTLLYSGAETVAILALILLPWGSACVIGYVAAKLARKLFSAAKHDDESQPQSEYRFTLRGMFLSIVIIGALTAWLSGTVQQWQTREETNKEQFLQRFTSSFTSGNVTLLATPVIVEDHTILKRSQNTSGISEYRIQAPINRGGSQRWAVWTYLCDERYPGTVSKFGYAESGTPTGLPSHPFPITEYLREPTYPMLDGEPPTGIRAEVQAPDVAKVGETITIVAETDKFLECDLVIRPFQAITLPPPKTIAQRSGIVRWDVKLNPAFRASRIEYEFQARTNGAYRARTVVGTIELETP